MVKSILKRIAKPIPKNNDLMTSVTGMVNCGSTNTFSENDESDIDVAPHEVEGLITELLRFLAMKELLDEIDAELVNEGRCDESFMARSQATRRSHRGLALQLVPSGKVQEAWEAMLFHPLTYSEVCSAMGCKAIIDFYAGAENDGSVTTYTNTTYDSRLHGPSSVFTGVSVTSNFGTAAESFSGKEIDSSIWDKQCYSWTIDCYRRLFNQMPPEEIWPDPVVTQTTMRPMNSPDNGGSVIQSITNNFWGSFRMNTVHPDSSRQQ